MLVDTPSALSWWRGSRGAFRVDSGFLPLSSSLTTWQIKSTVPPSIRSVKATICGASKTWGSLNRGFASDNGSSHTTSRHATESWPSSNSAKSEFSSMSAPVQRSVNPCNPTLHRFWVKGSGRMGMAKETTLS
jgi:hypothetical protein